MNKNILFKDNIDPLFPDDEKGTIGVAEYFRDCNAGESLDLMLHLFLSDEGMLYIAGEKGIGKTSLIKAFVGLRKDFYNFIVKEAHPDATISTLIQEIAYGFGLKINEGKIFKPINKNLVVDHKQNVLIIDNADQYPKRVLQAILKLSLTDKKNMQNDIRIILTGPKEFESVLHKLKINSEINTNINVIEMEKLSKKELEKYLLFKWRLSGNHVDLPFTKSILNKIYKKSKGNPLKVENIARAYLEGDTTMMNNTSFVDILKKFVPKFILVSLALYGVFLCITFAVNKFSSKGNAKETAALNDIVNYNKLTKDKSKKFRKTLDLHSSKVVNQAKLNKNHLEKGELGRSLDANANDQAAMKIKSIQFAKKKAENLLKQEILNKKGITFTFDENEVDPKTSSQKGALLMANAKTNDKEKNNQNIATTSLISKNIEVNGELNGNHNHSKSTENYPSTKEEKKINENKSLALKIDNSIVKFNTVGETQNIKLPKIVSRKKINNVKKLNDFNRANTKSKAQTETKLKTVARKKIIGNNIKEIGKLSKASKVSKNNTSNSQKLDLFIQKFSNDSSKETRVDAEEKISKFSLNRNKNNSKVTKIKPAYVNKSRLAKARLKPPLYSVSEKALLNFPSKTYCLQLLGSSSEDNIKSFIKKNKLSRKANYYETIFNGKKWYVLLYGNYNSVKDAQIAINDLSLEVKNLKPFPRKVDSIKSSIRDR